MVIQSKRDYLKAIKRRYRNAGRKYKKQILDEFCSNCGYHRKHAIRLLNSKDGKKKKRPGPPRVYGEAVREALKDLWLAMNRPCSKLLRAGTSLWLPYYEQDQVVTEEVRRKLLEISPASIDRVLKPVKRKYGSHGLGATRPVNPLKHQIPIKTHHSDVSRPGHIQADTVAHGGQSVEGDFVWTLTMTDIFSQWTEIRAVWNRGYHGISQAIGEIEDVLPFPVLGFHTDNGGEFLNHHLYRYFRDREEPVEFTRTRPDHKDDNCYVEQKNWTHVRQLLGYQRIEDAALLPAINRLYEAWSILQNCFHPTQKLESKIKTGSRYTRKYENRPRTPAQRLMESPHVNEAVKAHLEELIAATNPIKLQKLVDRHQQLLLSNLR